MDLLEQALTSSPVSQADSILAAIVRIVSGLLHMTKRNEAIEPLLTDLQLKIADKCSVILKKEDVSSKVCGVCVCGGRRDRGVGIKGEVEGEEESGRGGSKFCLL